jgi:hypothetical protein
VGRRAPGGGALIAVGSILLVVGAVWWLTTRSATARQRGDRCPAPLTWWIVAGAVVVAVVSLVATIALLHVAARAQDPASARVEAIKTGLSIGAGAGGIFALLLATRRQWHQERAAADTVRDAEERRITELYTKAADQLGSDQAPVRLAGLYALERLAQGAPSARPSSMCCARS